MWLLSDDELNSIECYCDDGGNGLPIAKAQLKKTLQMLYKLVEPMEIDWLKHAEAMLECE